MILLIIRMKVLPEKRMELSQAITSLIGPIRTEKGCLRCDFCRSMEDENELHILEEWNTNFEACFMNLSIWPFAGQGEVFGEEVVSSSRKILWNFT